MNSQEAHSVLSQKAAAIPHYKKQRFLLEFSEDDLLARVVEPILLQQGFRKVEQGSSQTDFLNPVFISKGALGLDDIYLVLLLKGSLNMSRHVVVEQALDRIKHALSAKVLSGSSHAKSLPTKVILFTNGKINEAARTFIIKDTTDPRLIFFDSEDLISQIDKFIPEFWLGFDADIIPYFRLLRSALEDASDNLGISDVLPTGKVPSPVTDKMFVPLRLFRTVVKMKRKEGIVTRVPDIEEMPVTALLNKTDNLHLILGEAGSGKSTVLKRLAYMLAEKGATTGGKPKTPILLRAVDINDRAVTSLSDLCEQSVSRLMDSEASFVREDLTNGDAVILIDALDELSDENTRRLVVRKIAEFHAQYPDCKIVLTSRPTQATKTFPELLPFNEYNLVALDFKQAEQIITRLQKAKSLSQDKSKELLRRLQQIHGVELNPLLVTVFAATTEYSRKDIPANITELFKKYTEMMLGRWDSDKGMAQQYHAPLKDFLLKKIAYDMHKQRISHLRYDRFTSFISKELKLRGHEPDTDQVIDEILHRSGLFRVIGDSVEFRHLLLQEFFAGRGIPSHKLLETYVTDEWWQRALVFYFGENPGDSEGLLDLAKSLHSKSTIDIYPASVALGLSLQACYLVEVKDKIAVLFTVIEGLTASKNEFLKNLGNEDRFPLNRFLGYYLFGRDAVACSFLEQYHQEFINRFASQELDATEHDMRVFWVIVGLIESGAVVTAEKLLRNYYPAEPKLLLAIYLGCLLVQHLRVTAPDQKKAAIEITQRLASMVDHLRRQVLNEFRTELLEWKEGKIKLVESES